MTILDTNVVSEPMRPQPSPAVMRWMMDQDPHELFITTITQAELLAGVERLPAGTKKRKLASSVEYALLEFEGRILPFDDGAAHTYPAIVAARGKLGRPVSNFDALIAAIARSRQAALATRDTGGFQHCGVRVINPWHE